MNEEKNIDVIGTFEKLVKADPPEMTQEEAIETFQEKEIAREIRKSANSGTDADNVEEQEHLKRVKQELIASLERVKKLEEQIYGEESKEKDVLKVKKPTQKEAAGQNNKGQTTRMTKIKDAEQKERE